MRRPPSFACRSRPRQACVRQGSSAGADHCTTRFRNAHRTVCRELLYRLHPWFGHNVFIHGAIDKAGGVFRCTLDGSDIGRSLEIPAWMFDRAACAADVRFSIDPFVSLESLGVLSVLLDQVLKIDAQSSNARLADAYGVSRDRNRGETHGTEDDGIGDWGSAQTVSRVRADGLVRKPALGRRARLDRPAEGCAGSLGRPDDAADPRLCAGDRGGRP